MGETVLVIGGGAREHAITWKLTQSALVEKVYVSPGNPGTASLTKAENVSLDLRDHQVVADFCLNHHIRLVVVGPEDPLAEGISDSLAARGIACFGPSQQAAQIEASKEFSKQFMQKHGIPTARFASFTDAEKAKSYIQTADFPALVVKASGLAAGKGVIVAESPAEACAAVDELMSTPAGGVIVVEELLEGDEVSALAFSDGETAAIMWPSQDHKRLLEEDRGPNTGGMGAYCPCPLLNQEQWRTVEKEILQKTVDSLRQDGILYRGVLYAGLMVTKDGPKVLEFNCRFGDPETEVILPLLESDLLSIMKACVSGTLKQALPLKWKEDHVAVGVVMASEGYPGSYPKGKVISGLNELPSNCITFHAGTASHATDIVTNGGRVLCVVGLAPGIQPALNAALEGVGQIHFDGAQYRRDIARRGIARALLQKGKLKYEHAGVSIDNGEAVVRSIKPLIESTFRSGVVGTIGGFGGLFDLKKAGYSNPLLVSGTDGVGTKVKIAQELNIHNTVGIDLVAMCVNDILAHGAEPLFFLDYLASGKLHVETNVQLVAGIAEGCRQAGCSLVGGETAEMPGMYPPGEYDLAGFTVGAVEESQLIPRMADIQSGDVLIGLASSGVHSNGFSLVRKVVEKSKLTFRSASPFSSGTLGEALLTPTKIYVKTVLPLIREGYVKALAHITGGGLTENIPRVLPPTKCVTVDAGRWPIPPVFGWLAAAGEISEPEMVRTFNCGLGLVLIVDPTDAEKVLKLIGPSAQASVVGTVQDWNPEHPRVQVKNFATALEPLMRPHLQVPKKKKRVGVLISGSGTNLQALIDHTMNPYKCSEGEIVVVISNVAGVQGLVRAEKANIRTEVISHKDFSTRLDFDNTVTATLKKYHVDFVCLAGFMRILTKEFVAKWHGRLINIHPALLPSFKGIHAQKQALEAGVTISGCTVHFVETEVDTGAIISQRAVPVLASDNEESLVERIKEAEHLVYPEALELLVSGLVSLGADGRLQRHSN